MCTYKKLSDDFSATIQIFPEQMETIKKAGYKAIIINRPDGEKPDQPLAADIIKAANAAGLEAVYIPMKPGQIDGQLLDAMGRALEILPKPILGHCATGLRSTILWSFVNAPQLGADGVISAGIACGYDIEKIRPALETMLGVQK